MEDHRGPGERAPARAVRPDQLAELAVEGGDPPVRGQVGGHRRLVGQGQPAQRPGRAARHRDKQAASRSRASRAPRKPAPPVITTFVTASPFSDLARGVHYSERAPSIIRRCTGKNPDHLPGPDTNQHRYLDGAAGSYWNINGGSIAPRIACKP